MSETKINFDPKDIEENKALACLSYVGVLCLVPLLAKKDSKYAQAHAKQGLALFIAEVIVSIIPFLGWLVAVVLLVMAIISIVNCLQGKLWEIPLIYDLSKKLNF